MPTTKEFKSFYTIMKHLQYFCICLFIYLSITSCEAQTAITVGANNTNDYVPQLVGKNVAIVANQTTVIFKGKSENTYTHLVDSLRSKNINITKVFSPEHGFRGKADAAEHVSNGVDDTTGIPIISLYGKNKKPTASQLENTDVVVFDIQDVGVRFYTYISTLHYVMEACAENAIPLILLDRPNPNGHYIDGPTLDIKHRSFVGMHPVPLVYGMTIGEYAKMINGEHWLKNNIKCKLTIITMKNYTHHSQYSLPVRPSPNLPNSKSINLYPSLGFFEGTPINAGRGTEHQFQRFASSKFDKTNFSYTPNPNFGSKYPKDEGKTCYGFNLENEKHLRKVSMSYLVKAYHLYPDKKEFFGATFTIHAGGEQLRQQLEKGYSAKKIENSWSQDIIDFKKIREKYLLYN